MHKNNLSVYRSFLEILQQYQRESTPVFLVRRYVTRLFEREPDLIEGFEQFLPESGAIQDTDEKVTKASRFLSDLKVRGVNTNAI
jgi:histone deacetylase complex regulatory component SIN3